MKLKRALLIFAKRILMPLRIRWALRKSSLPVAVVVGANDGRTGDPLYPLLKSRHSRVALLIEPVPYLFKRLEKTYAALQGCECINIAIGPARGSKAIYYINPAARAELPGLPPYFEELASFDRDRVVKVLPPDKQGYVQKHLAQTMPLSDVLAQRGISHVDVLQIDTEGFDYEVLKTFPFATVRPDVVIFEHCHLNTDDRSSATQLLKQSGYRIEQWGKDYLCILTTKTSRQPTH